MMTWDFRGRATWRETKKMPCPGPAWEKHYDPHHDEYGNMTRCPKCAPWDDGNYHYPVFTRVPEFDAPQPPKNWSLTGRRKGRLAI